MGKNEERRKSTRVMIRLEAELKPGETYQISGCCTNLSAEGMFIECDRKFKVGDSCHLNIVLGDRRLRPTVEVDAKIIRVTSEGMGIQFTKIHGQGRDFLENIVLLKAEDPEKVEKEIKNKTKS